MYCEKLTMATLEERLQKAHQRAHSEHVRPIQLEHGTFLVASSSHPGHGYLVHVDTDGATLCSCPAAQWEFPCKHAAAVQELRCA